MRLLGIGLVVVVVVAAGIAGCHHTSSNSHGDGAVHGIDANLTCPPTADPSSDCSGYGALQCAYGSDTSCSCAGGAGAQWLCTTNTCPWWSGTEPCVQSGTHTFCRCNATDTSCVYANWEHECDCGCSLTTSGYWWSCTPATVGSQCPSGAAPIDAGVL